MSLSGCDSPAKNLPGLLTDSLSYKLGYWILGLAPAKAITSRLSLSTVLRKFIPNFTVNNYTFTINSFNSSARTSE